MAVDVQRLDLPRPTTPPESLAKESLRAKISRGQRAVEGKILHLIPFYREQDQDTMAIEKLNHALSVEEKNRAEAHKQDPNSIIPVIRAELELVSENVRSCYERLVLQTLAIKAVTLITASAIMNIVGPIAPAELPMLGGSETTTGNEAARLAAIFVAITFVQLDKKVIRGSAQNITRQVHLLTDTVLQKIVPDDRVNPGQARADWEKLISKIQKTKQPIISEDDFEITL